MQQKQFIYYVLKFIGAFCIVYFGTKAIIGLTVPGGYYNEFVKQYIDYPALLRNSLLNGTKLLVAAFGFDTYMRDPFRLAFVNGKGIHLVYACLGIGLFSFWIAFVFANKGIFLKKAIWIIAGCLLIWIINVIRISVVLIGTNKNWKVPLTLEHHTFYNIIVYSFIFLMIWMFFRSEKMPGLI